MLLLLLLVSFFLQLHWIILRFFLTLNHRFNKTCIWGAFGVFSSCFFVQICCFLAFTVPICNPRSNVRRKWLRRSYDAGWGDGEAIASRCVAAPSSDFSPPQEIVWTRRRDHKDDIARRPNWSYYYIIRLIVAFMDNDGSDDDYIRDESFQCKQNTASIARIIKPIIP